MKITFKKISAYAVPKSSHRVASLLMGEWDPPPLNYSPQKIIGPTLCSTALRAKLSVAGRGIRYTPLLNEIRFNPAEILRLNSRTISSRQVRQAFITGWIKDRLAEPRSEIIRDVTKLLLAARQHRHCLVISHTFRLTLIRAYLNEGDQLLQNPELISKYIHPKNKLLAFDQEFTHIY